MASGERTAFENPVVEWIDSRLPIFTMMQKEYGVFPTPKNFNYFWNFGAIAMVMLMIMLVTGIFLAMHYTAHTSMAFDSVERIMRDVNSGWLIRYIHMNGASFFFIAVYIHMFRGMYYGSFKKPRELLWILGVLIFVLMMATAFMGYVLPWGQMSYWGATVITNLFSAIPFVGDSIVTLLWGGFSVDNPTLNRFFALHYLMPFVIFAVVFLHVWALHVTGSNNPLGIEPKGKQDTLPFHPYYTMKDTFGTIVFLFIYAFFVFYAPDYMGHPDNYIPADPLVTPAFIVPEWYFLPFYAMLRSITFGVNIYIGAGAVLAVLAMIPVYSKKTNKELNIGAMVGMFAVAGALFMLGYFAQLKNGAGEIMLNLPLADFFFVSAKLGGVAVMFGSLLLVALMPWLDTHGIRSARFRPLYKTALLVFVALTFVLGIAGGKPAEGLWVYIGQLATLYYLAFFLVILPLLSRFEKGRDLPPSIHEAVLQGAK